jgi:predicted nucleic acid-binding protein
MPRSANDCVVAAVAVEARIPLLHDDRDFEQLVAVETRLRLVPRH